MSKLISRETWPRDKTFTQFAEPGDQVDAELAMNFLNGLPPVSLSPGYFQAGGACYCAYDSENERMRPTYCTFGQRTRSEAYWDEGEPWTYLGCCFKGKTEHIPFSI